MSSWRRGANLCAALVGAAVLLVGAPTASAHTDFESSSPAQGDVVAEPVSSVVLVFSADTRPVDDLVVALDATGTLQDPTGVSTDDQRTFTVTFDPPLAGGDIGIRWTVLGADGHPLEGAFSFTVTAPRPTATTAVPVATEPVTPTDASTLDVAPADTTSTAASDGAQPDPDRADSAVGDSVTGTTGTSSVTSEPSAAGPAEDDPGEPAADASTQSLDDFLAADGAAVPGDGRRLAGRLLSIPALALTVGALAFLALAMRGPAREIAAVVSGVRIAAVAIAVGALIHYLGSIAATGASFATGWTETPATATAIRLVGAILVVAGLRAQTIGGPSNRTAAVSLSAAVIDDVADAPAAIRQHRSRARWDPAPSKIAFVGVALLVASFWFDGHTVTEGWRPLHALVNSVHVVAGSVWFGGVVTLAALGWWRSRRGDPTRIGELVVRFSSIATVALAAVAAAGLVLAFFVLDGIGDLTGTEWGRTLLLKTGAVAVAAALGAYNHFRLRPAVVDAPDDPALRATLRSVLTSEAIILVFVAVVTCWLVAAAT